MRARITAAFTLLLTLAAPRVRANPITDENALAGSADWSIVPANVGTTKSIDAYPSRWSVRHGDTLGLRVSTTASSFRTRIYRLGWYGGLGARLVRDVAATPGALQPTPTPDPVFGLAECNWRDSISFGVPNDWTPGVYYARFTGDDGLETATWFVVRDDGAPTRAPILMVLPSTTDEAYNAWPAGGTISTVGKSLYGWDSRGDVVQQSDDVWAVKVSFDRPFAVGAGTGDLLLYAYPFLRWAEKRGYFVSYATSVDVDDGPVLDGRTLIVEAGHDEYWSYALFDHFQAARDAGVHLAFFTGDTASWQVRFEPSSSGDPRGTMVGYKEHAYPADPGSGAWPGDPYALAAIDATSKGDTTKARFFASRVTGAWAELQGDARRPGMIVTGVAHGGETTGPGFDWIVRNSSHWVYAGTGLHDGDALSTLVGYEWDNPRVGDSSWDDVRPAGQIVLAESPTTGASSAEHGASFYVASSGANVFTAGTIQWSSALDPSGGGSTPLDPRVETMTANVLDHALSAGAPAFDAGPGSDDVGPVLAVDASLVDADADADAAPTDDATVADSDAGDARADATIPHDSSLFVDAAAQPSTSTFAESSSCGCRAPRASTSPGWIAILSAALAIFRLRCTRARDDRRRR